MKKQIFFVLAVALTLGVLFSRSEGQGGTPSLQGQWSIFSITDAGKSQPVPMGSTATFTKDKLTMHEGKTKIEYSYHLDPSKSPHWIDLSVAGVPKKIHGIYEVKGNILHLCFNSPGGARSTHFESKAKTENDILMVFKRKK